MMERLNDIMGRTVQRRPSHYGYNEQSAPRIPQQERREQGPSESVTRIPQQESRTYPTNSTPRQSRPLPEQLGRGGYSARPHTTGSAGHTGRIESSERLGRIPASQPSVPPMSRPQQNEQEYHSNAPGNVYGRERHSMPAVSRQQSIHSSNPSGIQETRTHQLRPNTQHTQRYSENTNNTGNPANSTIRAYQPPRNVTPSQQDEAYHPLKTRPIPAQLPAEDYTVSPRARADAIDSWESDERATGMQYGDWEEDEQEIVVYQRPTTPYYEQETYTTQQQEPTYTAYPQHIQHPHVTRNLHEVRIQEVAAVYPMQTVNPVPHPTLEPAREQYHRMTQPLDPRLTRSLGNRERIAQPADINEYSDSANYGNYRTTQDAPLPTQRRPIRSLSQVKPPPKEMASVPAPAAPIHVLAPISQSAKQVCRKCGGAGYLRADVPFGHPNFGKPIACECKEAERKEKRRQQLRDMSNMDAFRDSNFRTFNARMPGVQEAYQVAHEFAQDPDGWLLLIGPNGCGKTHLAAAIANQSLDSGSVVLFAVVPDLLDHLRAAFAPTAKEVYDQLFSKMREAELLVLDDLGAQQSSPWANEKLFQLLNYRYNMGMPTVITANPKGLQGVDERIRSRLCDVSLVSTVIMDKARDYRPMHPRRDV